MVEFPESNTQGRRLRDSGGTGVRYRELRCGLCGLPVIRDRRLTLAAEKERARIYRLRTAVWRQAPDSGDKDNHCQCQTVGGDEFKEWEKALVVVDEGIVHVTEEERCSLQTREEKA
jgi:hypothetical protein